MQRCFSIPGKVKGKQRPKVALRGQFAHAYTPQQTVDYETYIKQRYLEKYSNEPPITEPIMLIIECYYKIPNSFSKAKAAAAEKGAVKPMVKPDLDNVAKIVCDALNSIAYHDDNQICSLLVKKQYGLAERVEVTIYPYLVGGNEE